MTKEETISGMKGAFLDGDKVMLISTKSDPFIFKRFQIEGEPNKSWYNSASGGDGHKVKVSQDVLFGGFGVFYSSDFTPFECKYILKINDKVVHNNETLYKCDVPVDQYYF